MSGCRKMLGESSPVFFIYGCDNRWLKKEPGSQVDYHFLTYCFSYNTEQMHLLKMIRTGLRLIQFLKVYLMYIEILVEIKSVKFRFFHVLNKR